jgi:diguanylate cyclase (GGDEF)-like protein
MQKRSLNAESQDNTIIESAATLKFPLAESAPYLVIIYPREQFKRFQLRFEPQIIGRSDTCEIQIDDDLVSRQHCAVRYVQNKVLIEDLGSTNGSFIDGQQIFTSVLNADSRLQIGKVIFKVEFKDSSEIRYDNELYDAATTDALTRVSNRHAFMERTTTEIFLARRENRYLHLLMLDVDFFKKVNDTHGHQAGDFILKEVARLLKETKRGEDLLGRFGGEEFIMLFREVKPEQAQVFADRLRLKIANHKFLFNDTHIPITVSMGLCSEQGENIKDVDSLIARADAALYRSKEDGRNCLSLAD